MCAYVWPPTRKCTANSRRVQSTTGIPAWIMQRKEGRTSLRWRTKLAFSVLFFSGDQFPSHNCHHHRLRLCLVCVIKQMCVCVHSVFFSYFRKSPGFNWLQFSYIVQSRASKKLSISRFWFKYFLKRKWGTRRGEARGRKEKAKSNCNTIIQGRPWATATAVVRFVHFLLLWLPLSVGLPIPKKIK